MPHKPFQTLLFVCTTFFVLALIAFVFPEKGIYITKTFSIHYPTATTLFFEKKIEKTDISSIIALADAEEKNMDKSYNKNTINAIIAKDSSIALNTSIQYKNTTKTSLSEFFKSLSGISSQEKSIRILHYGDSQIEGDRITDYLRSKLQAQFGGSGPGLISLMPVAPSVINKVSWSPGWERYPVFVSKDKRVKHTNYGPLAHLTRFNSYVGITDTTTAKSAWLKLVTSKNGGANATSYNTVKLFYGGAQKNTHIELYENGILNSSDSLASGGLFNVKNFILTQKALLHEFKFKGKDSPDFYAISLESGKGIMVDNIGLRGSSGTFFNQINTTQLKQFYDYLNTKLIIFQYGGNALPSIKSKLQADNYGNYLKYQISIIKKIAPHTSILVIGPADMSVKVGEAYQTHPYLENLRDAIKRAAFETDCAFFDMYNCMGGKNSMQSWVEQSFAAKDYIHFSPAGARKISVLLHTALINDYNRFLKQK